MCVGVCGYASYGTDSPEASGLDLFPNAPVSVGMFEFNRQYGKSIGMGTSSAPVLHVAPACTQTLSLKGFCFKDFLQIRLKAVKSLEELKAQIPPTGFPSEHRFCPRPSGILSFTSLSAQ